MNPCNQTMENIWKLWDHMVNQLSPQWPFSDIFSTWLPGGGCLRVSEHLRHLQGGAGKTLWNFLELFDNDKIWNIMEPEPYE